MLGRYVPVILSKRDCCSANLKFNLVLIIIANKRNHLKYRHDLTHFSPRCFFLVRKGKKTNSHGWLLCTSRRCDPLSSSVYSKWRWILEGRKVQTTANNIFLIMVFRFFLVTMIETQLLNICLSHHSMLDSFGFTLRATKDGLLWEQRCMAVEMVCAWIIYTTTDHEIDDGHNGGSK